MADGAVFAALELHETGIQALKILKAQGKKIEPLCGPEPFVPTGAIVFVSLSFTHAPGCFRNKYLRVLPEKIRDDRSTDCYLANIADKMGILGKAAVIVFINASRAHGESGCFEGPELHGFTDALRNLCGVRVGRRRNWRSEPRDRRSLEDRSAQSL